MKFRESTFKALFFSAIVLACALFVNDMANASTLSFDRTLRAGMSGKDVQELQKLLNMSGNTRVALSGPGSPGQETTYFGEMTQKAVIRFQEMRMNEILIPNGLTVGTGIVGPATRKALNIVLLAAKAVQTAPVSDLNPARGQMSLNEAAKSTPTPSPSPDAINPNLENIDLFLSTVDREAKNNGISGPELDKIKSQILIDIATSTNLQEEFIKIVQRGSSAFVPKSGSMMQMLSKLLSLHPKSAEAQIGADIGFGGMIYYTFYCSCSQNWLLTIQSLPPSFATLLTYQTGSQAYLSYNLPFSRYLLGKYTPGAGQCSVYIGTGCASIPSQGMITSTVGSSQI